MTEIANLEMAAAWDGDEGEDWARDWRKYDRAVQVHHDRFMAASAIQPGEQVLDIGCGNGLASRDAARASGTGLVVGIDLSHRMLDVARSVAAEEGLGNVRFEHGDAQVHPFEPGAFDVAISRFGAMFFGDRVAAFTNIGRALRPGGRLVLTAWREIDRNEWLSSIRSAMAVGRDLPVPPPDAPSPFGLADPERNERWLTAAGFEAVAHAALDAPFWLGDDADEAFAFFTAGGPARGLLGGLDEEDRAKALHNLREVFVDHETPDGVVFGSGTWIVTAVRTSVRAQRRDDPAR